MAKKKAATKKEPSVGYINIALFEDGTYDIDTKVTPAHILTYAEVLAQMIDGQIVGTIITRFAASEDVLNQDIALALTSYLKALKTVDKPLISPDRVFRKNKKQ